MKPSYGNQIYTLSIEQLLDLQFPTARAIIKRLPEERKQELLKEADQRSLYMYNMTAHYYDAIFNRGMNSKDFQKLMNRLKHLEILIGWLYGIE